jgi:two-component system chemotaxis response regulator CheY
MRKFKALVIDDSRVMRSMLMQGLKKTQLAEFEFVEAEDGKDALAKMESGDFQVAFVDWNMPNMTGIEFVRAVREQEKARDDENVPLVMVTSEKTMSKIEEALDQAGADAFICKPFTPEELGVKLKKVMEKAELVQVRKLRKQRAEQAQPVQASSGGLLGKLFG